MVSKLSENKCAEAGEGAADLLCDSGRAVAGLMVVALLALWRLSTSLVCSGSIIETTGELRKVCGKSLAGVAVKEPLRMGNNS